MALRFDRGTLQPAKRDASGFLRADALVTRTGVFKYQLPDGSIFREYRPPAEVFKPESLATFDRVPVTDDHPPVMVDATNATAYTKGTVGERATIHDNKFIACSMVVYDAALIEKMDAGKTQISVGYICDVDMTPGTSPEGEAYDGIQKNIVANHVAVVQAGRAGNAVCVRMDDAGWRIDDETADDNGLTVQARADESERTKMDELKKALAELAQATARADAAEAKIKEVSATLGKVEGERDALRVTAENAEKARKDAADSIHDRVRARVQLEQSVKGYVEGDVSKMDDRAIKVAAIKKLDNADVPTDKSDDYVDGRFAAVIERATKADADRSDTRKAVVGANGGGLSPEAQARAEMIAYNKTRHVAPKA